MDSRSRLWAPQRRLSLLWGVVLGLGILGCGPPNGADLEAAERDRPGTKAGCEEATPALLNTNQNMLPGRDCGACHRAGGQAANSPFTVAGTAFTSRNDPCNPGGVANLFIEIQDEQGNVQPNGTLRTNPVGNFYSAFKYTTPMKIRIYEGDSMSPTREQKMIAAVGIGSTGNLRVNCNECHQNPGVQGTTGRVFIQ